MLSPEDRTVYKWIVTWAQDKLSGEKAPLGAAVPAKLLMEPEHILTKAKTKRRGQGQRVKRRRAASSRPSRKEDKATGPAPPAQEEDPAPAASRPDDVPWKIVDCHRRTKRKRENSTSSPTKASKHASAPSPPPQPGKQCYCCQGFGHKSRTCCLPPVCAQCSGSHYSQVCIDARVECTPPVLQRLQGDRSWPTFQVLPCQACPCLPAVQFPWEGSTACARHGHGHPVYASAVATTCRRRRRSVHRWDLWGHGYHAACVPGPCQHYRRYSAVLYPSAWEIPKLQPEVRPPCPVCWISTRYRPRLPRCCHLHNYLQGRAQHHWQGTHRTPENPGPPQPVPSQDRGLPPRPWHQEERLGDWLGCPGIPTQSSPPGLHHQRAPEDVRHHRKL